jgi:hypothetical protein
VTDLAEFMVTVDRLPNVAEAVVELVWMPGPNPCQRCWENGERFFRK